MGIYKRILALLYFEIFIGYDAFKN